MKKTFICVNYYTDGEKSSEYKKFLVKNVRTGTNWFNPGLRESIPKPRQLECLESEQLNLIIVAYNDFFFLTL